ncbi:hypothetical protein DNTS_004436, partial [Danionella cerebrum]
YFTLNSFYPPRSLPRLSRLVSGAAPRHSSFWVVLWAGNFGSEKLLPDTREVQRRPIAPPGKHTTGAPDAQPDASKSVAGEDAAIPVKRDALGRYRSRAAGAPRSSGEDQLEHSTRRAGEELSALSEPAGDHETMASELVCGLLFRLLLPVCLAAACLFRYNLLSFIYLIFLLLIPLLSEPTASSIHGHTGLLLRALCLSSLIFLVLQIIYQISISSLLATESIHTLFNCSSWEKAFRQLGFQSVRGADAGNGIRVFIPDIGMLVVGLITWFLCRSLKEPPLTDGLQQNNDQEEEEKRGANPEEELVFESFELGGDSELLAEQEEDDGELEEVDAEESNSKRILHQVTDVACRLKDSVGDLITSAGRGVITILLGITGMMLPSLSSLLYFLCFLGLCSLWSLCRGCDRLIFSSLCVLMAIFSAGHLLLLFLYQLQIFQEAVPPPNTYASLFGISAVIQTDCAQPWMLRVNPDLQWHHFLNPIMLLVLYYTLATLIRLWKQESRHTDKEAKVEAMAAERLEADAPGRSSVLYTAETRRELWRMAHYHSHRRNVLLVTASGAALDFSSVPQENSSRSVELYSRPHYGAAEQQTDPRLLEAGMFQMDPGLMGLSEFPGSVSVVPVSSLMKIFRFIMKQSYICALIAMMAWSITYVSWLTFVFLIWSCALWMVRDRRRYSMLSSPFMVLYGNFLILLQYVWSFESLQPVPGLFLKRDVPFRELASKAVCLLSFWLLLRQFLTERRAARSDEETQQHCDLALETHDGHQELMEVLGASLMALLNKYWIYICGGMFFFVSFEGKIVIYKIIYMMMFLFCVALYQLHYERWRAMLKFFWMAVVVYTMLVLILVYTFQFDSSVHLWSNMTGFSREKLEDLGLEKFSVAALFWRIFIPSSFLLVCILHLHYFHQSFLELTDIKTEADRRKSMITRLVHLDGSLVDLSMVKPSFSSINEEEEEEKEDLDEEEEEFEEQKLPDSIFSRSFSADPVSSELKSKWHLVLERLSVLFLQFLDRIQRFQVLLWWLLELHIIKIVSAYIIWVSVKEVSLLNSVFVVSWAFALPFAQFRSLASSVCCVWSCIIIVCKMLYQLNSINPETHSRTCNMPESYTEAQRLEMTRSLLYSGPVDPANWIGLRKFSPLLENLRNNLLMLALLAFEVTVYRHQEFFRMKNNLPPPVTRTVFHDITRQHLDDGIVSCAKYFINYFFYKFGLETCFLLAVNVIGQRMDFYAALHAFGLIAVMFQRRRRAIAGVWSRYCCFLSCLLSLQYLMCIGIPPAACSDYPWRSPASSMDSNVIKWLYLPDFHTRPNPLFLLYDFLLLLCASLQARVFEEENLEPVKLLAGDNEEMYEHPDEEALSRHIPVPDFLHCRSGLNLRSSHPSILSSSAMTRPLSLCGRSYLDMLKVCVFSFLFWLVLTVLFITGTTRISIFCMGYLLFCFFFLIFGGELLMKPVRSILRYWDCLIAYNIFVITMKNILSIAACGYIKALVLNHCWLIQLFSLACTIKGYSKPEQPAHQKQCELPNDEAGIIWDSVCFAFLLLQRRAFNSCYHKHTVQHIRSSLLLASRQQKFRRGKEQMLSLVQDQDHHNHHHRSRSREREQEQEQEEVVRSGHYYLFESDSEEEEEEEDRKEEEPQKRSAFQFVYHAWITDSKTALREQRNEQRRDAEEDTPEVQESLEEEDEDEDVGEEEAEDSNGS